MEPHLDRRPFVALLETRIGLDVASIGHDEIARAVSRRIEAGAAPDARRLLRILERDADEWDAFAELFFVQVSWFFREPTAFELLDRLARERQQSGDTRRFRVLSAACATGEEPYSIAMTLVGAGLRPDQVHVEGLDISPRSLAVARTGTYEPRAVRLVGDDRLESFFVARDGRYTVRPAIRRMVHFGQANLVEPGVLAHRLRYDVVFCRNALMYFTAPARAQVLASIDGALRPEGWLLTGHAESGPLLQPRFASARVPRTFAFRKADLAVPQPRPQVPPVAAPRPIRGPAPAVADDVRAGARHPAGGRVMTLEPPQAGARLARVRQLADGGTLDEARRLCLAELADVPASAEAYHLLGLVESARGERQAAEAAWRRAVYLEPRHAGALRHLALARRAAGDSREAARLMDRAQQAEREAGRAGDAGGGRLTGER